MGISLIKEISSKRKNKKITLGALIVKKNCLESGKNINNVIKISNVKNIKISNSIKKVINDFDVLIDFTNTKNTLYNIKQCAMFKKKIVIGTTGFTKKEINTIKKYREKIGIVISSNFSIGINLMLQLLKKTATKIGKNSDIEIIEYHHNKKIDAPSGTALTIGNIISKTMNWDNKNNIYSRKGKIGKRKKKSIGFSSVRAGNIIGDHTVIFDNSHERIEITHKAHSRCCFAKGAIHSAIWLKEKNKIGLFKINDVLC